MTSNLPFNNLTEFKAYAAKLWHEPPLNRYTPQIDAFWSKYGYKIKVGFILVFVITIVSLGISLGLKLSAQNRLKNLTPPAITVPTLAPTSVTASRFEGVLNKIKAFSTLLPDPAPPSIDENIRFSPLPQER